jgi:hypothetical protein
MNKLEKPYVNIAMDFRGCNEEYMKLYDVDLYDEMMKKYVMSC